MQQDVDLASRKSNTPAAIIKFSNIYIELEDVFILLQAKSMYWCTITTLFLRAQMLILSFKNIRVKKHSPTNFNEMRIEVPTGHKSTPHTIQKKITQLPLYAYLPLGLPTPMLTYP